MNSPWIDKALKLIIDKLSDVIEIDRHLIILQFFRIFFIIIMFALLTALVSCGAQFYVMAPLDVWINYPTFKDEGKINWYLDQMRNAGVDGIMIDVWWGFCEKTSKNYDFSGYKTFFAKIKDRGMKIIPVMSFHQCGGNVGDTCSILLPDFVRSSSKCPFFKDSHSKTFSSHTIYTDIIQTFPQIQNLKLVEDRTPQ